MANWYLMGLYLCLAMLTAHVYKMIGGTFSSSKVNYTLIILASLVTLGWTIWGATIRWSATGIACSSQYPTGAT